MKLSELTGFDEITIQCHDNPDPDAIASAFALYEYFKLEKKKVRIIYSGRNRIQKPNLKLMIEKLQIPVEYSEAPDAEIKGLLLTVDCQYKEGNVTFLPAKEVACIDHHVDSGNVEHAEIRSYLGSCSTLVWDLLLKEKAEFEPEVWKRVQTALYYGLLTDTGNFIELHHPMDRDMRDVLEYDKSLITLFCNSNISIDELQIAGIALIRNIYVKSHRALIIRSNPCDPNILGLIADLALQVDGVDVCLVYNETEDGYKLSVRSCVKETHANELAEFLVKGIGSAGGHFDKAGGYISKSKLEALIHCDNSETFLGNRIDKYFHTCEVIYAKDYVLDTSDMKRYKKREDLVFGFSDPATFLTEGSEITIRTLEGDVTQKVCRDFYIMIGLEGEVYPIKKTKFNNSYMDLKTPYVYSGQYEPVIRDKGSGKVINLVSHAGSCRIKGTSYILARELKCTVKIFTTWDEDNYYLGLPGDFIACRGDDGKDVYVIRRDIFYKTYVEDK